jgi:low affinity Fe/Cu permease
MPDTTDLKPGRHPAAPVPERISLFQRIADRVSYGMGTPTNIAIWIVLVVGWTLLFAVGGPKIASGTWLPVWFTSTGFNFPLNLVTTVAELYIGFLVGASSNRSERNLEATLARLGAQEEQISVVERKLSETLEVNTSLTREVHELTKLIHAAVTAPK